MKTLSYIFIFLSIYQCFSLNLKSSQLVSPSKDNLVESFSSAYGNNKYVPPVGVPMKSPEISNHISDEVLEKSKLLKKSQVKLITMMEK